MGAIYQVICVKLFKKYASFSQHQIKYNFLRMCLNSFYYILQTCKKITEETFIRHQRIKRIPDL